MEAPHSCSFHPCEILMLPPWSRSSASLPPCFRRKGWIVSVRATGPSSHCSPAPDYGCLCLGKPRVKGESIPPLMVTSSSQLRRMLWECLVKPAASSHRMPEHLWQFSTENSGRQQKTWVEHILTSQSKIRHGQAYPQVLEILRDMETKHKICKMAPPRPANGEQREDLHGATPLFTLQMKEKPSSPHHI